VPYRSRAHEKKLYSANERRPKNKKELPNKKKIHTHFGDDFELNKTQPSTEIVFNSITPDCPSPNQTRC